jgi:hypothetical protein
MWVILNFYKIEKKNISLMNPTQTDLPLIRSDWPTCSIYDLKTNLDRSLRKIIQPFKSDNPSNSLNSPSLNRPNPPPCVLHYSYWWVPQIISTILILIGQLLKTQSVNFNFSNIYYPVIKEVTSARWTIIIQKSFFENA